MELLKPVFINRIDVYVFGWRFLVKALLGRVWTTIVVLKLFCGILRVFQVLFQESPKYLIHKYFYLILKNLNKILHVQMFDMPTFSQPKTINTLICATR